MPARWQEKAVTPGLVALAYAVAFGQEALLLDSLLFSRLLLFLAMPNLR